MAMEFLGDLGPTETSPTCFSMSGLDPSRFSSPQQLEAGDLPAHGLRGVDHRLHFAAGP